MFSMVIQGSRSGAFPPKANIGAYPPNINIGAYPPTLSLLAQEDSARRSKSRTISRIHSVRAEKPARRSLRIARP